MPPKPLSGGVYRRLSPLEVNDSEWLQQQVENFHKDRNHLTKLTNGLGNTPSVLIVDQFEDVFTLCRDENVRQTFIENIIDFIHSPDNRNIVILTMQADFKGQIAQVSMFQDLFEQAQILITALDVSELREAIEKPAELVGLKFEEGLVEALLKDVLGEPIALPLLQFTLLKLWDNRERNRVTWETYQLLGGGRQALTRSADEFYEKLIPEEQMIVKRMLLQIVQPIKGQEVTSNRIQFKTLYQIGEKHDDVDRVLDKLVQARLVRLTQGNTLEDTQVEIIHEALVQNWSCLANWLEAERETAYLRSVEAASILKNANATIRTRRRSKLFTFSFSFGIGIFLSFLYSWTTSPKFFQSHFQSQLKDFTGITFSPDKKLAVITFKDGTARLWNIEGEKLADFGHVDGNKSIVFSPDSKFIATISKNKTIRLWNLQGQELTTFNSPEGQVTDLVFSPDGQLITTTSGDKTIRLWNLQGQELTTFNSPGGQITNLMFSPDSKLITTTSGDKTIRLWNLQGQELTTFNSPEGQVTNLVFSPNSKLIATTSEDKTIRLWNLQGQELTTFNSPEGQVTNLAFSSNGKLIATTSENKTIRLWDLQGNNIAEFPHGNTGKNRLQLEGIDKH
ncbi:WD40 repeat domain-containing protein [Nostoc sp. FACHB-87]|uniref:WD40 repeat domain-containing protein n=1 Tax=Nostocaceae TaxID=1162 RepID=UPI00168963C8|nr:MULTISPECIES: WD40 repeat domain-containing protein [Nostocaceae]MBD2459249.1 WD40 repeat domain-containing protein [Nostoc sp. FACHB-87]MBD2480246.1 WD40 repeat domain-containing protein [Anabaena sp. FACHB-83]